VVAQAETLADGLGGKALDKEGMQRLRKSAMNHCGVSRAAGTTFRKKTRRAPLIFFPSWWST
jgi:hypothetical protein